MTTLTANNESEFDADIRSVDAAASPGSYTIFVSQNISETFELAAINLHAGVNLTINGQGNVLDGDFSHRGLFVYSGAVTIEGLHIQRTVAIGGNGGGGGAGLGGGLFVAGTANGAATPGNVTLLGVTFSNDGAIGGNGEGAGTGGGGLGGSGGLGGGGIDGNGGNSSNGEAGIVPGATGGGNVGNNLGGPSGGGGGASSTLGAGGGVGGGGDNSLDFGAGGFGGGGGSSVVFHAGDGGFGGGGGGGALAPSIGGSGGGGGGFGGGGGAGGAGGLDGPGLIGVGGAGGFGGGHGANSNGLGGGGLAAGGDIFVQQGGLLTISDSFLSGGSVTGGSGAQSGSAYGAGIFLQGNQSLALGTGTAAGFVTDINDVIADMAGSHDANGQTGVGNVIVDGLGAVALGAANTYTGGTTIEGGTLELAVLHAAGSGAINFASGVAATLQIDAAAISGNVFENTINGLDVGDTIDLRGLMFSGGASATYNHVSHILSVTGHSIFGSTTDTLLIVGSVLNSFGVASDNFGGTDIVIVPVPTVTSITGLSSGGIEVIGEGQSGDRVQLYVDGDATNVVGSGIVTSDGSFHIFTTATFQTGIHRLEATEMKNGGFTSSPEDSVLFGTSANDTLTGPAGAPEQFFCLGGNDLYIVGNSADQVYETAGGGTDRVEASVSFALGGGQEIEILTTTNNQGTAGIALTGNEFNNVINGNAGNDVLDGGAGADVMHGFGGNDWYYVDNPADLVYEAVGGGTDRVLASASYALGAGQEIEQLTTTDNAGIDPINLSGNAFSQTINGNAGNNIINGAGGVDAMRGFGGNDTYYIDNAGDQVYEAANGGTDRILTSISYTLAANQSIEQFTTTSTPGTAPINLTGNALAQTISGNNGNNVIDGGGGGDAMRGYAGNDTYFVNSAADAVYEAASGGTDRVEARVSYTLTPGQGIEALTTADNNGITPLSLTGNSLAQTINGNAGDNIIDGGGGDDLLRGMGGDNTFVFTTAPDSATNDVSITDFSPSHDLIELSHAIYSALPVGALSSDAFFTGTAAHDASDRIVYSPGTGALLYDADGNGAGAAVQFAKLPTGLNTLGASQFVVSA